MSGPSTRGMGMTALAMVSLNHAERGPKRDWFFWGESATMELTTWTGWQAISVLGNFVLFLQR